MEGVKQSYAHSLRIVYLASIGFGLVGVLAVCFCKDVEKYKTDRVDILLDEGAKIHAITDTGEGYVINIEQQEMLKSGRMYGQGKDIESTA